MTWKVELQRDVSPLVEVLSVVLLWDRLTKKQQAAISGASDDHIDAHPLTVKALERHGLVVGIAHSTRIGVLTEAGRVLAKWNHEVKP